MATNHDSQWQEYLQSLNAFTYEAFDGTLSTTASEATRLRDSYRSWLFRKLDEATEKDDTSFLEEEILRLQGSSDEEESRIGNQVAPEALNRWGARYSMEDALYEYGIIPQLPRWGDMGWTVKESERDSEAPTEAADNDVTVITDAWLKAQAQLGPDLCWVKEEIFETPKEAQEFEARTRKQFRSGNHSAEILSSSDTSVTVLYSDSNWNHRNRLAAERDKHFNNALRRIVKATSRKELDNHVKTLKRYSRDMQTLNEGHTLDNRVIKNGTVVGRKVGIGFPYPKFATLMNAVADRASELGLTGYRTYPIREFEKVSSEEGDIFDRGARQGEHLGLQVADSGTEESFWAMREGCWKPSKECKARMDFVGSTGFIPRPWSVIQKETEEWLGISSISFAA